MKTLISLSPFLLLFLLFSCSPTSKVSTGEVNYLGGSEQGTILVSAAGYGKNGFEATANAEVNAFKTLIFRGVPGSQYHLPMIKNEGDARQQFPDYFNNLLDAAGYKTFMMLSEGHVNQSSGATVTQKVKINMASLRRDMEEQGVIRKFGL